jgi:hypothetical protein
MNIAQRVKAPTPKFFKILRTIGISLAVAGGTIIASPLAIPATIISIASYVILAGTVITAVSQTAVKSSKNDNLTPNTHLDVDNE